MKIIIQRFALSAFLLGVPCSFLLVGCNSKEEAINVFPSQSNPVDASGKPRPGGTVPGVGNRKNKEEGRSSPEAKATTHQQ